MKVNTGSPWYYYLPRLDDGIKIPSATIKTTNNNRSPNILADTLVRLPKTSKSVRTYPLNLAFIKASGKPENLTRLTSIPGYLSQTERQRIFANCTFLPPPLVHSRSPVFPTSFASRTPRIQGTPLDMLPQPSSYRRQGPILTTHPTNATNCSALHSERRSTLLPLLVNHNN